LQTADEYRLEYDSRRGSEYSRFHGYTYDGIWAVALAIQHVAHHIRQHRKNETVVDFQYRDPLWELLFLNALGNTSFEGVTVSSCFILFIDTYNADVLPICSSVPNSAKLTVIHTTCDLTALNRISIYAEPLFHFI
jgi:hypothetical protein